MLLVKITTTRMILWRTLSVLILPFKRKSILRCYRNYPNHHQLKQIQIIVRKPQAARDKERLNIYHLPKDIIIWPLPALTVDWAFA